MEGLEPWWSCTCVNGCGSKRRDSRTESSLGAEALNRNVGEAFEEFLKFTEGLKHQGSSGEHHRPNNCMLLAMPANSVLTTPAPCVPAAEQETLHLEPHGLQKSMHLPQRLLPDVSSSTNTFFSRWFMRQRHSSSGESDLDLWLPLAAKYLWETHWDGALWPEWGICCAEPPAKAWEKYGKIEVV